MSNQVVERSFEKAIDAFGPATAIRRHDFDELSQWVKEALAKRYPQSRKLAFSRLTSLPWNSIQADILRAVGSRKYERIHQISNILFTTDLLNINTIKKIGFVVNGTLAVISRKSPNISFLVTAMMLNEHAKDAKVETYILYRLLNGEPRVKTGLLSKV